MRTRLYSVVSFFWTLIYFIELRAVDTASTFVAATALLLTGFANCAVFCVGVDGCIHKWPVRIQLVFLTVVMLKFCGAALVALCWPYFDPRDVYPLFLDICLSAMIAFHAWFVRLDQWDDVLAHTALQDEMTANMQAILDAIDGAVEEDLLVEDGPNGHLIVPAAMPQFRLNQAAGAA